MSRDLEITGEMISVDANVDGVYSVTIKKLSFPDDPDNKHWCCRVVYFNFV